MTLRYPKFLRRFLRKEDGSAIVIEFVIFIPILFTAFLMATELGIYSMRQMFLDRGLDVAVRYIRLNTNTPITHKRVKDLICANAGFLEDCDETLRLELVPTSMRNFATLNSSIDCVDTSAPIQPVRGFSLGQPQQLMMLRACVKFKPVFATSGVGRKMSKDGSGRARMTSIAAFVQEP